MKVNELPLALYASAKVRELDRFAIETIPIAGYALMCRAGQAALNTLQANWPNVTSIDVCCGPGNNGGDGLVLARLAKLKGLNVRVFCIKQSEEKPFSEEMKQARADWLALNEEIISYEGQTFTADVIVDALLGIGAHLPLAVEFQQIIQAINQSQRPVFAIDIPSGLNADTGYFEQVVKASATITFIGMKLGLVSANAIDIVGELFFDDLGVDTNAASIQPDALRLDYNALISQVPKRRLSSHKGDNGHVCVIGGGQSGYSGAVCLAGEAALRAGSGLVSAVVAPESLSLLARGPSELMCYGLADPKSLPNLLDHATLIVLGPGLSQSKWAEQFFTVTLKTTKPLIVDADGLNWLAKYPQNREQWILTPHPGEAARLLGCSTQEVQGNRIEAAKAIQRKYGGITVLKGAGTIIYDGHNLFVNIGGFPALGTGGTGDVLAGLIGGLAAQGLSLLLAAQLGVSVHSLAAQCEQSLGARGMLASDLFLHVRSLLNPAEG